MTTTKRSKARPMRRQVQTRLTPAQSAAFDKYMRKEGVVVAAAARMLIARGLKLNQEVANEPQAD